MELVCILTSTIVICSISASEYSLFVLLSILASLGLLEAATTDAENYSSWRHAASPMSEHAGSLRMPNHRALSNASVVTASSNPNDAKIEKYEQRIVRHEAEIEQITNGAGLYTGLSNEKKLELIKSKEDGIHDCETGLQTLRAQQQQSNGK